MALNLRPFGNLLSNIMYKDFCTVYRVKPTKDEYGAEKPDSREIIYENIRCKLSFTEKDSPADSNGVYMPVLKQVTIFTSLDHIILAGDYIIGERFDDMVGVTRIVKGICGQPNIFETHQEIPIQIEEEN